MSKFCKKCSAALEEGAGFCESCGAPVLVAEKTEPAVRAVETAKKSASGNKLLLGIGGGIVGLVLIGVAASFLTGAPATPSESSLSALLNADDGFKRRTVCLGNFQYDHNVASINADDQNSQQWFGILVDAGLYSAPQFVTTGGWYSRDLVQYTPTDKGKQAIKNGKLCFAQGVVLDKVTYGEVQKIQTKSYATADYTYHFLNADEWTKRPEAKMFAADVFDQETMTGKLVVERADKDWMISNIPAENFSVLVAAREMTQTKADSSSTGFLAGLTNLFSGLGGNPLIGKWRNDISGDVLEFTANKMIASRGVFDVSYEIDGNKVKVSNKEGASTLMRIDKNHMTFVEGNLFYKFTLIDN